MQCNDSIRPPRSECRQIIHMIIYIIMIFKIECSISHTFLLWYWKSVSNRVKFQWKLYHVKFCGIITLWKVAQQDVCLLSSLCGYAMSLENKGSLWGEPSQTVFAEGNERKDVGGAAKKRKKQCCEKLLAISSSLQPKKRETYYHITHIPLIGAHIKLVLKTVLFRLLHTWLELLLKRQ